MRINVMQGGRQVATINRKSFQYGRRKRAVRYQGEKYGVRKSGGRFSINVDRPLVRGAPMAGPILPFIGPIRQNPLGLPWWVWVGGGALALYLATKKAAAKVPATMPGTNMVIQPSGGWGYPPMTPATFASWCKANNGLQTGGTCLISNKGAYTLSGSRIKQGGEWVLTDEDLF